MESLLIIEAIFTLREWCRLNLPTDESYVAYDIILVISINHYAKIPISVKHLFSSVPHSYTATRYHYKRLIAEGWLEHSFADYDNRVKFVKATDKLINTINNFVVETNLIFDRAKFV